MPVGKKIHVPYFPLFPFHERQPRLEDKSPLQNQRFGRRLVGFRRRYGRSVCWVLPTTLLNCMFGRERYLSWGSESQGHNWDEFNPSKGFLPRRGGSSYLPNAPFESAMSRWVWSLFFQKYWSVVGGKVRYVVLQFLNKGVFYSWH